MYMADTKQFLERFNRWKNGAPIQELYQAGRPVKFDDGKDVNKEPKEDPALRAALKAAIDYKLSLDYDKYDEGKDVAGSYNFNAIHKVAQNAPLSYGSYYDLTGDFIMDNRLPKYKKGKESYESATDFITHYEGRKDSVYKNPGEDFWTGGYGTTDKKWTSRWRKLGKVPEAEARKAMTEHLTDTVIPQLRKNIPGYDKMPEQAQWVLQDILYNVGEGNLFKLSPNFMRAIKKGDWAGAAAQMDWDNNKKGYETGARDRNAERQRIWNSAWGIDTTPAVTLKANTKQVVSHPFEPVEKYNPPAAYTEVNQLLPSQAAYNPSVPASINKDAGTATWPRNTFLPSVIDVYNSMWGDGTTPLKKPW